MENQGNQQQRNIQQDQPEQSAQQRIQQYEEIANHFTEAATALRNNDVESSERHYQQAQKLNQRFHQPDEEAQDPNTHM